MSTALVNMYQSQYDGYIIAWSYFLFIRQFLPRYYFIFNSISVAVVRSTQHQYCVSTYINLCYCQAIQTSKYIRVSSCKILVLHSLVFCAQQVVNSICPLGVQCKQEVQESVTWARTPAATNNGSVAVVKMPCPGFDNVDNSTIVRKYQ